jgi:hypothetical protein
MYTMTTFSDFGIRINAQSVLFLLNSRELTAGSSQILGLGGLL